MDRGEGGRFVNHSKQQKLDRRLSNLEHRWKADKPTPLLDHDYVGLHHENGGKRRELLPGEVPYGTKVSRDGWRYGRRVVEVGFLLEQLAHCRFCLLGPVPLTHLNLVGEQICGLGGFFYVQCTNLECEMVNIVPYGKQHQTATTQSKENKRGNKAFAVNTKLGCGK